MSFVHLHVHTQYSLLDGANKIGPLIEHAFGKAGAVVGATSVAYDFADTVPTLGLQIGLNAGYACESQENANGAWCEQLSIEGASGEAPKITASGADSTTESFFHIGAVLRGGLFVLVRAMVDSSRAVDVHPSIRGRGGRPAAGPTSACWRPRP